MSQPLLTPRIPLLFPEPVLAFPLEEEAKFDKYPAYPPLLSTLAIL